MTTLKTTRRGAIAGGLFLASALLSAPAVAENVTANRCSSPLVSTYCRTSAAPVGAACPWRWLR